MKKVYYHLVEGNNELYYAANYEIAKYMAERLRTKKVYKDWIEIYETQEEFDKDFNGRYKV